jgi:hypothetical protein
VRVPGERRRDRAGEGAIGLFQRAQPAGQLQQGGVGEAGPDLPAILQARRCLDAQQQRAQQRGALAVAWGPAADHHVLSPLVLDLEPVRGAAAGQVGRVQPFEHHALEPVLQAGGQHRRPGAGEAGRHANARARQAQVRQQRPPLRVRGVQQGLAVEVQEVEHQVGHRHGSGQPRSRLAQVHPALQDGETRPAILTGRHDLAIQDQLMPPRQAGQAGQLGIGPSDVPVQARAQPQAAARDVGDRAQAVPFELRRPPLLVGGQLSSGRRQHRADQPRESAVPWPGHAPPASRLPRAHPKARPRRPYRGL